MAHSVLHCVSHWVCGFICMWVAIDGDITTMTKPSHELARQVMDDAYALMGGDRNDSYGDAWDNFGRIAELLSGLFGRPVLRSEVAAINIMQKIARSEVAFKDDNGVDLVAYAAYWAAFKKREADGDT